MKLHRLLAPLSVLLLAACAGPMHRPEPPSPQPVAKIPPPERIPPPVAETPPTPAPPPATLWDRMRKRFAMNDCGADPAIEKWARRFTRHKHSFQKYIRSVQPTMAYIEDVAEKDGVPAEFVLLPWVESRYRTIRPRRHRAAGMWQIMAITARTLKLPVRRDYDGRLDRMAATNAVMKMLGRYDARWHDWRLVDMAFNAGQYRIRRLHTKGPAPAQPVIPDLAVSHTTRAHLTQLMAMACVIREPARFGVKLPRMDDSARLEVLELPRPATLRSIARTTDMGLRKLRALNGAYLHDRMPSQGPWRVILPQTHAARLRQAIAANKLPTQPVTYTVVAGDSLWEIAHHNDMSVARLQALNNMQGKTLHPGQVLRISAAE